jgi:hypothetical protein
MHGGSYARLPAHRPIAASVLRTRGVGGLMPLGRTRAFTVACVAVLLVVAAVMALLS